MATQRKHGDTLRYLQKLSRRQGEAPGVNTFNNHVILVVFMSARAVQSRKAAGFSIVCKVNSLNIALKASLNLGNQWEYRFNEIFNQIFPYCAGFRVFSEIVRDCAALTELCGPAPAHPVRSPGRSPPIWMQGRFLPLIIGNLVASKDERWQLFNILLDINDIVFSPVVNEDSIGVLEGLIEEHHATFIGLYPGRSVIPKMHYMIHFPSQMLRLDSYKLQFYKLSKYCSGSGVHVHA